MFLKGCETFGKNLRGMKNFHRFPKNTPTGYPYLKKTGPLGPTRKLFSRSESCADECSDPEQSGRLLAPFYFSSCNQLHRRVFGVFDQGRTCHQLFQRGFEPDSVRIVEQVYKTSRFETLGR